VLAGLCLENIALIEWLQLALADGFTVHTVETGPGKSILMDALLGGDLGEVAYLGDEQPPGGRPCRPPRSPSRRPDRGEMKQFRSDVPGLGSTSEIAVAPTTTTNKAG
jgi:hypothetical protein